MGLTTTTAGWFPKLPALRRARWQHAEGDIDDAGLREAEDAATREVLKLQSDLGLSTLVDGQMERSDLVGHWAGRIDGLEEGLLVRCWGNRYYRRPRVEDDLERAAPVVAPRYAAARKMTEAPLKAVITGPYTLMDWSFDEHYGSREACCRAFAEVIRAEVADLVAAGAEEIQLDEPAISARPNEMALVREVVGQVVEPMQGKARSVLHICYGDLTPVLDDVLALPVDALYLELANSRLAALHAVPDWPADKHLVAGIIDVTRPEAESVDELASRIERVLTRVPADRLSVGPDAGLNPLSPAQARSKLEHLVEAADRF